MARSLGESFSHLSYTCGPDQGSDEPSRIPPSTYSDLGGEVDVSDKKDIRLTKRRRGSETDPNRLNVVAGQMQPVLV